MVNSYRFTSITHQHMLQIQWILGYKSSCSRRDGRYYFERTDSWSSVKQTCNC